ncbi:enoyl-CoA hydratase/isomerase family protein [Nocardioides terrisoli]|uniref:enoyl-CoA hydratase/isomerase family protein n=1 Tax=Nocardioides terrisoli TaxID=3388267 RepID=UPI00287B780A|nr:enoyl-CoA hydratase/isomerase family protein [Nocardioides marmorisolisilvae]
MPSSTIEEVEGLCTDEHDGVVIVTLDRPPANAMNRDVIRGIACLFNTFAEVREPPPVVITGGGERFFCAGGDIKELDGADVSQIEDRMREFHRMLVAMDRYPRPVVAAVNGYCVGGGVEYAMFADLVLAAPHARFGFPEINHGLLPAEKGIERVARLVGVKTTRALLLTGDLIDADRATQVGLVDAIVEPNALLETGIAHARSAGDKAPVLYAALKRAVNDLSDSGDERRCELALENARAYFDDPVAKRLRGGWEQRNR